MSLLNPENNVAVYNLLTSYCNKFWREDIKNIFFDHLSWCREKTLAQVVLATAEGVEEWVNRSYDTGITKPSFIASKNILIDGVETEVKVYGYKTFSGKDLSIGFAILKDVKSKMDSFNSYATKLMWFYRNNLISKESMVNNINHLSILEQQQLRCLSKVDTDKPYFSFLTHYFQNLINPKHEIESIRLLGVNVDESDLLCDNGFLLPLKAAVYFNIDNRNVINLSGINGWQINSPPVLEQYYLTWHSDDLAEGAEITQVNPKDNVYQMEKPVKPGFELLNALVDFGIKEKFKESLKDKERFSYNFLQGKHESIQQGIKHRNAKFIGSINLIKNTDGSFTIAPILSESENEFVMEMYFADAWQTTLLFVAPEVCTITNVEKMIVEFMHYSDVDVKLSTGSVSGGGYTYTSIAIEKMEHKFYQDDVDAGIIVLGNKR